MRDEMPEANKQDTVTDDEIVTERRLLRRAFLSGTGVFLAGGAAALIAGARTVAQQIAQSDQPKQDPDKPRPTDQPRPTDRPRPDDRPRSSDQARPADPDTTREGDTAKKRRREKKSDPDKPRATDPTP